MIGGRKYVEVWDESEQGFVMMEAKAARRHLRAVRREWWLHEIKGWAAVWAPLLAGSLVIIGWIVR